MNTDLARKPMECLEYIVVHEMVHLLEPTHNARFTALMDQFMPKWQSHRDVLKQTAGTARELELLISAVGHETFLK
jgi:predicted metal-dependent hydrolase